MMNRLLNRSMCPNLSFVRRGSAWIAAVACCALFAGSAAADCTQIEATVHSLSWETRGAFSTSVAPSDVPPEFYTIWVNGELATFDMVLFETKAIPPLGTPRKHDRPGRIEGQALFLGDSGSLLVTYTADFAQNDGQIDEYSGSFTIAEGDGAYTGATGGGTLSANIFYDSTDPPQQVIEGGWTFSGDSCP